MDSGSLSDTQRTMVLPLLQEKNIIGKPSILVSSKGIVNGLSNIPNDGADFGPDTTLGATAPGEYGAPYTQTTGLQETVNYGGNSEDVTAKIIGEIKLSVPVILPAKNITIIGSLYNINTNGANPTRGASAIVADTDFQPITYNGVSVNYLLYSQTEITDVSNQLNIYGILFSGYPISVGSESSTTGNTKVNGISINNVLAHVYIDYCKINLLNNGIVINSDGGPKYIGHTHWTYTADNAYGVICNGNTELVLDSPEFFTATTNPNAYIYISNYASVSTPTIRISNATFANVYLCQMGAIQYGNHSTFQVSNSYIDGSFLLAPIYDDANGDGSYAGIVELDNIVFGNNHGSNGLNVIVNASSSTALNSIITIHNLVMYDNVIGSVTNYFYFFYQQSNAVYQSGIQLYINGFYPANYTTSEISNIVQIANVSGYEANIHLTGITNFTSSTAGTTAGTVNMDVIEYTPLFKKIMITFNGYENDTTTDQTILYPLPFTVNFGQGLTTVTLTLTLESNGITITAPNSTNTYSGFVIIQGY